MKFAPAILLLILLAGCQNFSATRGGKVYHNITAHYNGYFNAREKLKEVERKLLESQQDDYTNIITLFPTGDAAAAGALVSDLDLIRDKCSKVIRKHGVSKWVDDCYLLIGKSYYYKKDYFAAIETFQGVNTRYSSTLPGQEALVWIARSYIEMDKLKEAELVLKDIEKKKKLPDDVLQMLALTQAEFAIRKGNDTVAMRKLQVGINSPVQKVIKTRYIFVLGQLRERLRSLDSAQDNYKTVIKRNPPYDLAFQSKLGIARTLDLRGKNGRAEAKAYLRKMLKDDKNITYQDQIYYQLARIALAEGNTAEGINLLKTSVRLSTANPGQKAQSYLTLANLYFEQPSYKLAKSYYDSGANALTAKYPDYPKIKARQAVLGDLVANLTTIQDEDSLQRLSQMSPAALDAYVNKLLADDLKKIQDQLNEQNNPNFPALPNTNAPVSTAASTGYFDNPVAVTSGQADFRRKWGDRPLRDDWRRADAGNIAITQIQDSAQKSVSGSTYGNTAGAARKYYERIPLTPAQLTASNARLQSSLYGAGSVYYEKLNEPRTAQSYFTRLVTQYPRNENVPATLYKLYRITDNLGDSAAKNRYRNWILDSFPTSSFARQISNPGGYGAFGKRISNPALESWYATAYSAFKSSRCPEVALAAAAADSLTNDNYLRPKFEYLQLICTLGADTSRRFTDSLSSFVTRYRGTEVANQAEYILNSRKASKAAKLSQPKYSHADSVSMGIAFDKPETPYGLDDESQHYFVFIASNLGPNSSKVRIHLSNFNSTYFRDMGLQIVNSVLGDRQAIIVRTFPDKNLAQGYLGTFESDKAIKEKLKDIKFQTIIITETNWKMLTEDNTLDRYLEFYNDNYLR